MKVGGSESRLRGEEVEIVNCGMQMEQKSERTSGQRVSVNIEETEAQTGE